MRCLLIGLPLCLFSAPQTAQVLSPLPTLARPVEKADDKAPLPGEEEMKRLAKEDPVAFLEHCLRRYRQTVKGYTLVMEKQERINGKLNPREVIEVCFREEPHSVYFRWTEGARRAERTVYVEGENNGKMLVKPNGLLLGRLTVEKDPDGEEAKDSGRYSIKEFGLRKGLERTIKTWKDAKEGGTLFVEFLGEQKLKEAGDRTCYVLKRSRYAKPESDGVLEVTVYIDKETWLQVGSVIKGKDGDLIGTYYFRDIKLNPELKAEQFQRDALRR